MTFKTLECGEVIVVTVQVETHMVINKYILNVLYSYIDLENFLYAGNCGKK